MEENGINSIEKDINMVARNSPVALVVGAAGFLGSHLVESLLSKHIQVIGIDNFSTGSKDYLTEAVRDKNFHLVNASAENSVHINTPRLDYLLIVAGEGWNINKVLEMALKLGSKIVFVSFIELYEERHNHDFAWFKQAEAKLAKFAQNNKLNARVVRLAGVYGPRMHFRSSDPIVRLIQASLLQELQKESTTLDFSVRSLYVDDAVKLIIKSMLSGSTASKIYDGALPEPIKVEEVKQVLIDPIWYEARGFSPSELPPWPTPNLVKTIKELAWRPQTSLVKGLKATLVYFKDNEIKVPGLADGWQIDEQKWESEKKRRLGDSKEEVPMRPEKRVELPEKRVVTKTRVFMTIGWLIIFVALVLPFLTLGFGVVSFRHNLGESYTNLTAGRFEESLENISRARFSLNVAKEMIDSLQIVSKVGFLAPKIDSASQLIDTSVEIVDSSEHAVLGSRAIFNSLKAISGDKLDNPKDYLKQAEVELSAADNGFSRGGLALKNSQFGREFPFFQSRIEGVSQKVTYFGDLVKKGRTAVILLPQLVAVDSKKSYLVLLQNNNELRPTGGFIGSVARVDFEGGKLKKLEVSDVYAIDGQLQAHIEPPKEIRQDLGQQRWYLRDSNWEPDFPTSARQAEWFYNQIMKQKVDGVIALDLSSMEDLLSVIGPLQLSDYNETITSDNLFERSVTHAEQNFFPGSEAKKNFLTSLETQIFNKIFFDSNQNWPGIVGSLGRSLEGKHLMVYLDNPKMFSYIAANNWAGVLPRPVDKQEEGMTNDFLAVVEANLGANKANYYLQRSFKLATVIGKDGEVSHRLEIKYTNSSPADVWPAGEYKNRFRIYLPFGTKMNSVKWGETDISSQVASFVDFGRTGYNFLIELAPKQQKILSLDYQLPNSLNFKDGGGTYHLNVVKQAGTLKDPFNWQVSFPINYRVDTGLGRSSGPQQHLISTDLSTDRLFEIKFNKQ